MLAQIQHRPIVSATESTHMTVAIVAPLKVGAIFAQLATSKFITAVNAAERGRLKLHGTTTALYTTTTAARHTNSSTPIPRRSHWSLDMIVLLLSCGRRVGFQCHP